MKSVSVVLVAIFASTIHAKTAQQLRSDLLSILPSGSTKARLVWSQGGTWRQSGNKHVFGVDSDDGVIRQITTDTIDAYYAQLTEDGQRVIYHDARANVIKVINFDGSNSRTIQTSGTARQYWRDPVNKTDWVVVSRGMYGWSPFVRINIDNPTQEVVLWNGTPGGEGSPEIGISADGTRIAAFFGDPGMAGVANVTAKTLTRSSYGGCGMGMARDNTYDYFVHWGQGHHGVRIINGTTSKATINFTTEILAWARTSGRENNCHDDKEFQDAKWTKHRDYFTFSMFNTNANPFIFRVSDRKWIHIHDDIGCTYTHGLDVVFLSGTSVKHAAPGALSTAVTGPVQTYRPDGRRISNTVSGPGIVLVGNSGQGSGAALRARVMR